MMNMFLKYPSIINHYQTKEIDRWIEIYPELKNEVYAITEKLHGSNISFIFDRAGNMRIAKRSTVLAEDDNFFGVLDIVNAYGQKEDIEKIKKYIKTQALFGDFEYIRFHGEIFGSNIQKGVNYGSEKQIRFFDISINGVFATYEAFHAIMKILNLYYFEEVPYIGDHYTLEEALTYYDEEMSSRIGEHDALNIMEGIVIRPYFKEFRSPQGSRFIIKKKNESFIERSAKKKRETKEKDPEIADLNDEFKRLINDARIDCVFSKHGKIKEIKELGKYIQLILDDAKEEFSLSFEERITILDKKQQKDVFNVGALLASLLKRRL